MMRGEFIAVGDELLLGDTVNGNAATVGAFLAEHGVRCRFHSIVGDRQADIVSAIRTALSRAEIVIVSGGLGPTPDDLTREAVAVALGRPLVRDQSIETWLEERFRSWGRPLPESNRQQADVVDGATVIWPTFGTAPGLICPSGDAQVVLLPGVPSELVDMLDRAVASILVRDHASRIATETVRIVGVPESAVADRLQDLWDACPEGVEMAYLAKPGLVRVRFTGDRTDARIERVIQQAAEAVRERFGPRVLHADTLESDLAARLRASNQRLAVAESLTGGGLGERLTREPGASDWFLGGVIAYSDDMKIELLGVPRALIEEHGGVSPSAAAAMATGVRRRTGAEIGVALTGVAGPDALGGHAVGTVFVAVDVSGTLTERAIHGGLDRGQNRERAIEAALALLRVAVG